jgi:MtN3 and saliva related transmembrane protein
MNFLENLLGWLAFLTSIIGLIPQIYKTFQVKSAQDLSFTMVLNYALGSLCWIAYGAITSTFYVLLSNVVGLGASLFLMGQKWYYDAQNS